MSSAAGFVAVPVMPVFKGMSKEFAERLEKPARESGQRAGKSISDGLGGAVQNLERQVKASESKLAQFSRASDAAYGKQEEKKQSLKAATVELQAAEEKYNKALKDGKTGTDELAKVERAKGKVLTATNDLSKAEGDAAAAAKKYKDQQQDLTDTTKRLEDAQNGAADDTRKLGSALEEGESKSRLFEGGLTKVATASAALVAAGAGIGKMAYDIGSQFDDAYDSIRIGTGASGAALDGLEMSMRNVAQNSIGVGSDLGEIGGTLADLNTRLGVTGEPLERLTAQFQQLKGMDMETDINAVTGAFQQFGIKGEAAPEMLDKLFQIAQATGRPIDELVGNLSKSGPALQQFGFGLEESAGLLGALDKAGLDSEKTLGSMTKALGVFAKEGKDPQEALWGTIQSIDELTRAGKDTEAIDLANSIFGAKGGAGFVAAVQSGKFEYDNFMESIGSSGDTIGGVAAETADFAEKWDQFKVQALLALEPVASEVFSATVPALEKMSGAFFATLAFVQDKLIPGMKRLPEVLETVSMWIEDNKGKLLAFAGIISPIIVPILIGLAAQWIATGVASTISAANQVRAWLITKAEAVTSGAISILNLWKVGAGWIATGAQALLGAGRVVAAWVLVKAQAAGSVIASIVALGAGWIATGAQALLGAAQVAAAWVIGLGPIAWVTAAIAGLVAGLTWFFTQTEVGKEAWASFTGFLSSAWQTTVDALVAAWEWIRTTVIDAWNAYWTQVQENWALVTEALTAAWTWVKDLFIEGWALIQEFVINAWTAAWDGVRAGWDIFTGAIVGAWNTVKDGLVEAWNWIVEVVVAAWHREVEGMRVIWEFVTGALIGGWNWVKDTFVNVWNWIVGIVVAGWHREVNGMKAIFEFVTNAISGSWNWLKDTLHAGWTWINDNVFGALGRGLDIVKGWFQSAVDGIGRIWDGLKRAAGAPVKFVIDTVWNNGILGAWNKIADFLPGIDPVDPFKPEWLGQFKTGGVTPGYTPGRDVHRFFSPTGGLIDLSGGEAIMRPEWTRAVGGPAAVEAMNAAARRGDSMPFPAVANQDLLDPRKMLGASHPAFKDGGVVGFSEGGMITTKIQQAMWDSVKKAFPGAILTSGTRYEDVGSGFDFHMGQQAIDLGGPMQQIATWIADKYPDSLELFWDPGPNIDEGHPTGAIGGHSDHVHWAMDRIIDPYTGDVVTAEGASRGGGSGGGWLANKAKGIWSDIVDPIKGAITSKMGEFGKSRMADIPMAFFNKAKDAAWEKISGFFGSSGSNDVGNHPFDPGAGAEQWRQMIIDAFKFQGEDPRPDLVDALVRQVHSESNGNPNVMQNGYVDVNTGGNEAVGLLQFVPGTFQAFRDPRLPNDRTDPWANLNAGVRYFRDNHHYDTSYVGQGHGWKEGGVLPLDLPAALYDQGGWLPHGGMAVNKSGKPEPVFNDRQWGVLSRGLLSIGDLVPVLKEHTDVAARQVAATEQWLAKAANPETEEGVVVRSMAAEVGNIMGELGAEKIALITSTLLKSEQAILDARAAHAQRLEAISDKEKALADAQSALKDAMGESEEASKELAKASEESAEKIKDAEDKLRKTKEDNAPEDGDDEKDKKAKAEKIAAAEKDLGKVRKEQAEKSEESEKKRAETVEKANESVAKAEADLAKARLESIRSLDMPVHDLAPQLDDLASAGAKAAGAAGLGAVAASLTGVAALAGPAGISVGVALEVVKQVISIGKMIKELIEELIEKIYQARLAARKALADAFGAVADYAKLFVSMQENVAKLQQSLVRGMNEQRTAEFALRMAQQDRLVAEAEGALEVAQARLALDEEIRKAAVAAQIKLMGLHEDWDSYLSYQAMVAGGILEHWSDAAISALYTYEAARARALQGELKARVDMINAEAKLAEATRQNARNQRDLLVAQERLIKMSAKVAGVDLVGATGGAQAAKLLVEMFENQQAMDKNVLGRWGYQMGADGSFANEYRGQLAQQETLQKALDAVLAESGVTLDGLDKERLFRLMGETAYRGGDPMDVLRSQLPQLVEAETAIKINDSLKPIYEAKDTLTESERQVEDLRAEIDLYEKVTPLEQTIKGLDYTIKGLEQSSEAWAKDNEDVRGEYLAAAKANADAAHAAGVDWQLDDKYATGDVRDRIVKEEHIHLDGEKMYTADQIDELLARVTAGSNVNVVLHRSASDVADARRKESI